MQSALSTPRLLLRPWRDEDLEPFATMSADPRVMEHFPSVLSRQESDEVAARIRARFSERGWGLWALERREDGPLPSCHPERSEGSGRVAVAADSGRFLGFTGLAVPTFESSFTPCVEVGWRLAHEAWGVGYATEAAREALRFGFEELGLPEIVALTTPGNHRSRAVMDRLGMTFDRTFDHPAIPEGHPLRTHVLYRLEAARWRGARIERKAQSPVRPLVSART